jgi:Mrp family chromosome partitioning ATPase/capsular polysaccharide biosynthesis protein
MSEWNINQYIKALWRWAWLVILVTVVATGASLLVSRTMKPTYRASTTVMTGEDNTNPQVKTEDWVLSQRLASGYAGLAKRQIILEEVVRTLGLQTDWHNIQDNLLIAPVNSTSLLDIRVTDTDPQRAAAVANEIARQLILHSSTVANQQDLLQRQGFAQSQLDALQRNIDAAQASIAQKHAALDTETSARAVSDLNDQIKALDIKITDWRSQYEKLLGGLPARNPNTITVVETAAPPSEPVSPNVLFNLLLAAFAGLVLSSGSVFLMEYLSSGKLRGLSEGAQASGVLGLATITRVGKRPNGLVTPEDPHSVIAEQFRVLRSNLRFAWAGPEPIVLLVTSSTMGEGKSTISANLAASFAQAGKQTILVDADLRHPTLHTLLGLSRGDGLSSLLSSPAGRLAGDRAPVSAEAKQRLRGRLATLLIDTAIPNLTLLPAGLAGPTNPGELLASPVMAQLLDILRHSAEVIILDTPPILPVADTAILASLSLGVVLVAEADRTRAREVSLAREALDRAHARVLGFVLNKAVPTVGPYYTYHVEQEQEQEHGQGQQPKSRWHGVSLRLHGRT